MQTVESITEEIERLKAEQSKVMALAVYVGMTKEQAQQFDERAHRIWELYEALLTLKGGAKQP